MAAADAALYEAKRSGRDQVIVAMPKRVEHLAISGAGKPDAGWD